MKVGLAKGYHQQKKYVELLLTAQFVYEEHQLQQYCTLSATECRICISFCSEIVLKRSDYFCLVVGSQPPESIW